MRTSTLATIILTIALLSASLALGGDFYVSEQTGDDTNSGTAPDDAWRTITYALNAVTATADDHATIPIAAGRYSYESNGEVLPDTVDSWLLAGYNCTIMAYWRKRGN